MKRVRLTAAAVLWLVFAARIAAAPAVGIDEHPGARLPLHATVRSGDSSNGTPVQVGGLLEPTTPTLLVLSYFRCPLLCDRIVGDLVANAPAARVASGVDFRVLVLSFDPDDSPRDAMRKSAQLLAPLGRIERARWRFVVDDHGSAAAIASAVGFRYRYDTSTGQYAHPAVVVALTPDGRVSRYLYGVSFPPALLATALRDAAGGRSIASVDHILLTCFQYIPALRQHAAAVALVLRGGTLLLFGMLAMGIVWLIRRQQRRTVEVRHV